MRRSICYTEPHSISAGDVSTWKFCYTSSVSLPKGTKLKFDLLSTGKETDWQIPECNPKDKKNMIWAEMPDGKTLSAKELDATEKYAHAFEFSLPSEIKSGETVVILLGTPEKGKAEQAQKGNRAQTITQRRRPFHLSIDTKGKGDYKESEVFSVDIRGNVLKNIRALTPSIVSKNKRFDVVLRFEDAFGNLTHNAPEGTLIELSYEHLRENLSWKLFVPETGFLNLPNLYFNEAGVYKIQLQNLQSGEKFFSAPIKCFSDFDKSLYWGELHGEFERYDSQENLEACMRHVRDEKSMQFFASSSFESAEETSNEQWKQISAQVAEFNEESRFTTFLGFQWFSEEPEEGLRQCIYLKDNKPICRIKDAKTNTLKKLYKTVNPKEMIAIPSFTMAKGRETNFKDFSPEFERVVEIYNAWGSSECTTKEGNLRPITSLDKKGVFETEKGSIRQALKENCRFGFVAGGYDDRGVYEEFLDSQQVQYSPGMTAIFAIEQTREALMLALYNRQCYATTGERIIVGFSIAGSLMGAELNTKAKPGLGFNRHITGFVAGTTGIKEVSIIRNGEVLHTFHPKESYFEFAHDDSESIQKIAYPAKDEKPPFCYYYLRTQQEDGHIAWSSPIWIDHTDTASISINGKKAKKKA
ncbi:MAG: DUF3604 domain-containing protein [Chlamydiae bacterium]|nr:DUF3604 domain-containing protein [Chlamydiota bacterium]